MNEPNLNQTGTNQTNVDRFNSPESQIAGIVVPKAPAPIQGKHQIAIGSICAGFLYVLCFCGIYVRAGISSLLFFNGMSFVLYLVLKQLKLIKNPKAFLLAVPIFLLSACNSYFTYSYYNIFNSIGFFVLFSLMTLYAIHGNAGKSNFMALATNNCFSSTSRVIKSYKGAKYGSLKKVFLGICISLPVLAVIFVLLVTADEAFAKAFEILINWENFNLGSLIWKIIVFCTIATYFCGFYMQLVEQKPFPPYSIPKTDPTIAVSFLTPVNLLFLFFCISQFSYVKNGMSIPEFTTYARYVHEAFFQLLAVTFINFAIILVFTEYLRDFSHRTVRFSLITLCVFTFILILSSYYRMYLYITTYGFTPLRIEVLTFLSFETVLVFITIANITKQKMNILHHFVLLGIVGLLTLNVIARPEFAAGINENIKLQSYDYMAVEYYTQPCIPLLIEKYNNEENTERREKIKDRIEDLYEDSIVPSSSVRNPRKHWQSISIQEEMNIKAAKDFLNK